MLLLSCLLTALTVFPADTSKKVLVKTADAKANADIEDGFYCGFTEAWPSFPGGEEALINYLKKNIKYPAAALKGKVSGTIFVQFTVSKDGVIREVHPLGPYKGYGMEAEAIRVICNMPKWKPARIGSKPVDVLFNIPIRFILPKQKS